MQTFEIYWNDLNEEAQKRLQLLYHSNIELSPLAIIDVEEDLSNNEELDEELLDIIQKQKNKR